MENILQDGIIGGQNLLRNSGFTGDYLSEPLADQTVMDATKELFSDPLDHWEAGQGNKVVALEGIATSGYGVEFTDYGDTLRQELHTPMIAGESYVFSFKGRSTAVDSEVTIVLGGQQVTIEIGDEWKTRIVRVTMENAGYGFGISGGYFQICDLQLERGTIATAYSPSYLDNISDRAYYQSLKYVEHALNEGSTTIGGGLVLTNHIKVGNYANKEMIEETGGMQGTYNVPNDPFLWGGGSLDKAIETIGKYKNNPSYQPTEEELKQMANFVVTHGGRVILNDAIVRGTVYSKGGFFGGKLQMPFEKLRDTCELIDEENEVYEFTTSSSSHIEIERPSLEGESVTLHLPKDSAFDGWILDVYSLPKYGRIMGDVFITGTDIAMPIRVSAQGIGYTNKISVGAGYLRFVNKDGSWLWLNEKDSYSDGTKSIELTSKTTVDLIEIKRLIVASNSGKYSLTCNLPSIPYDGQEIYVILPKKGGVTIVGGESSILDVENDMDNARLSTTSDFRGEIRLTYANVTNKWIAVTTKY